ncbi:class F sortase [Glycomyces halotolerans]
MGSATVDTEGRRHAIRVTVALVLALIAIALASNSILSGSGAGADHVPAAEPRAVATGDDRRSSPSEPYDRRGLSASAPESIDIPSLGVDTEVIRLGLGEDGAVEVPQFDEASKVGWYEHSVTPGQVGASVLLGHVDTLDGPAVFAGLAELAPGDRITVTRADGGSAVFSVDRLEWHSKADFPTRAVYGAVDHPGLRLITCGGSFNADEGAYTDNLVVFATLAR